MKKILAVDYESCSSSKPFKQYRFLARCLPWHSRIEMEPLNTMNTDSSWTSLRSPQQPKLYPSQNCLVFHVEDMDFSQHTAFRLAALGLVKRSRTTCSHSVNFHSVPPWCQLYSRSPPTNLLHLVGLLAWLPAYKTELCI